MHQVNAGLHIDQLIRFYGSRSHEHDWYVALLHELASDVSGANHPASAGRSDSSDASQESSSVNGPTARRRTAAAVATAAAGDLRGGSMHLTNAGESPGRVPNA
jgi:hypothetical protein